MKIPSVLKVFHSAFLLLLLLTSSNPFTSSVLVESLQVAVIGTTGNVGRAVVKQLSKHNIPTRCLLRHDITNMNDGSTSAADVTGLASSAQIAASLAKLDNVEMIKGDISDQSSIQELIEDCNIIFALQGPPRPKNPLFSIFPFMTNPNDTSHPYMVNYIGVQNIIQAVKNGQMNRKDPSTPSPRVIRITAKGEEPFSAISILINMLGHLAKGWNYEGEQLLRESGLDYTIIRPGLLKSSNEYEEPPKARYLKDNGQDMRVSVVTYDQIADLCVDMIEYDNVKKSTLTVMNVDENEGEESYHGLLEKVSEDKRYFEPTLIAKHKMGARLGFISLSFLFGVFLKGLLGTFLMLA